MRPIQTKRSSISKSSVELDDPAALKMMADLQFSTGKKEEGIGNYQKAVDAGHFAAALDLAKALVDVGRNAEAINAYQTYLYNPHRDDGSERIAMAELIIMGAGTDYTEIANGLMYVVNVVQMNNSISAEVEATANRVAKTALKKLKGNVTHELNSAHGHLFLSFAPNGKIKKFDRLLPDGLPPSPEDLFDFSAKSNQVSDKKKKTSRNAPCSCGSGEKYKHCHGR